MNKVEAQIINRPSIDPVTVVNNANQALYKNCRQWREYATALEEDVRNLSERVIELDDKNSYSSHIGLTIPQYIADSLEKVAKAHQVVYSMNGDVFGILEAADWISNFANTGREKVMNPELFDYLNQDKSGHIETCIAFMNPLTRKLVEIVKD